MIYKYGGKHVAVMLHCGWAIKKYLRWPTYGDAYYGKDGLKWMFNITGLKQLGTYTATISMKAEL